MTPLINLSPPTPFQIVQSPPQPLLCQSHQRLHSNYPYWTYWTFRSKLYLHEELVVEYNFKPISNQPSNELLMLNWGSNHRWHPFPMSDDVPIKARIWNIEKWAKPPSQHRRRQHQHQKPHSGKPSSSCFLPDQLVDNCQVQSHLKPCQSKLDWHSWCN